MSYHVYRLYDREGTLLYIGASSQYEARVTEHRKREWGDQIYHVGCEAFESREAALTAEFQAIVAEQPLHNIFGIQIGIPPQLSGAELRSLMQDADRSAAWLGRKVGRSRVQILRWLDSGVPVRSESLVRRMLPPVVRKATR